MNNKLIYITTGIVNMIAIIGWIVLAIIFDKWWIALFATLFLASVKTSDSDRKQLYYRMCDKCGKQTDYTDSYDEALKNIIENGWISKKIDNKWYDYCPECQEKYSLK